MTKMRERERGVPAHERAEQIRKTRMFDPSDDRLSPPPGVAIDGYKYHYGRAHIKGYQDHRLEQLQAEGYEFVSTTRSSHNKPDPLSRNRYPGYLGADDCLLMEIPEVIFNEKQEYLAQKAASKLKALEGVVTIDPKLRIQTF